MLKIAGKPTEEGQPQWRTWSDVWRSIGPFNRWQILVTYSICLTGFYWGIADMCHSFIATEMQHFCMPPEGLSPEQWRDALPRRQEGTAVAGAPEWDQCLQYDYASAGMSAQQLVERVSQARQQGGDVQLPTVPCSSWIFNQSSSYYETTIQKDFLLVCDDAALLPWHQSTIMLALGGLALVIGAIADKYGRRIIVLSLLAMGAVGTAGTAFAPNYALFLLARSAHTVGWAGAALVGVVLANEIVDGATARTVIGTSFWVPYTLGLVSLPAIAYGEQEWRRLFFIFAVASLVFLPLFWIFPESPRWLSSVGRQKEAERILRSAAKFNGRTAHLPDKFHLASLVNNEEDLVEGDAPSKKSEPVDTNPLRLTWSLFATRNCFRCSMILILGFPMQAIIYYAIAAYSASMPVGNAYINFALGGLIELPAYPATVWLYERYSRRWPLFWLLVACSASLFGIAVVDAAGYIEVAGWAVVGAAVFGKFCSAASYAMLGILQMELFPTTTRGLGTAWTTVSSRSGAALAPHLSRLGSTVWRPLPQLIFAGLSIALAFFVLLLPETKGLPLPQTPADIELLGQRRRLLKESQASMKTLASNGTAVSIVAPDEAPKPYL